MMYGSGGNSSICQICQHRWPAKQWAVFFRSDCPRKPINIALYNVQGLEGNLLAATNTVRACDIGFIQEHWILKYRQDIIRDIWEDYESVVASVDEEHPYSPLQPPRGFGGVAVVWKKSLTRLAKPVLKTPSIAAVELTIEGGPLLVVSVYMPCRGYSDSDMQFRRVLDQLHQLLEDNVNTPTIIGGDWNASRVRDPPLPRDGVFSQFITQAKLTLLPLPPNVPTFLHHNGKDSSQIDYILIRDIAASQSPRVLVPPLGTSDHHVVVAAVEVPIYPHPTPSAAPHTGLIPPLQPFPPLNNWKS